MLRAVRRPAADRRGEAAAHMGSQQVPGERRARVTRRGELYDVTDFLPRHPGGAAAIRRFCGKDVTRAMESPELHRHSSAAYGILDRYRVPAPTGRRKNDLVDWKKPLLQQIPKLGDKYFDWVHQADDRKIRLFQSDILEFFSVSPWWLIPLVWIPVMVTFIWYACQNISRPPQSETILVWLNGGIDITLWHLPLIYMFGVLQWTLIEYVIHRWVFHLRPPNFPILITLHFILHGQHHKTPMNKDRLVFPPVPASFFATLIYALLVYAFPKAVAQMIFSGVVGGYTVYDLTHYYLHHGNPGSSYFRDLKRYHMDHHYLDFQSGFGITTKFWDYPFGTTLRKDKSEK